MDEIALSMGFDGDSPCRVEAALTYELSHNLNNGHVFLPRDKLLSASAQLISAAYPDALETALDGLLARGVIVQEPVAGVQACYLQRLYQAETQVAQRLLSLRDAPRQTGKNVDKIIAEMEARQGIAYAPQQRRAVELAARSGVLLLTGGPGTGKTTSTRGIVTLLERMGLTVLLLAPTGRAAKRMSELCSREAQTIHRCLGMTFNELTGEVTFKKNEKDLLEADAVIVDEMSMVDLPLMDALLAALKPGCRLVMVGDPDQLPSVGPGNVLGDILRSGAVDSGDPDGGVPPGGAVRHHPQRPRREPGPGPGPEQQAKRLFLPVPPLAGPAGADGGGPVPHPSAGQDGHPRRADPGADPHPQGGDRHRQPEPGPAGGSEPPGPGQAPEGLGRHDLPGGGPGDADPEQL